MSWQDQYHDYVKIKSGGLTEILGIRIPEDPDDPHGRTYLSFNEIGKDGKPRAYYMEDDRPWRIPLKCFLDLLKKADKKGFLNKCDIEGNMILKDNPLMKAEDPDRCLAVTLQEDQSTFDEYLGRDHYKHSLIVYDDETVTLRKAVVRLVRYGGEYFTYGVPLQNGWYIYNTFPVDTFYCDLKIIWDLYKPMRKTGNLIYDFSNALKSFVRRKVDKAKYQGFHKPEDVVAGITVLKRGMPVRKTVVTKSKAEESTPQETQRTPS